MILEEFNKEYLKELKFQEILLVYGVENTKTLFPDLFEKYKNLYNLEKNEIN